jgi:hypothetical protein
MEILIKGKNVICPQTNESISIEKLNIGLSKFYGNKIQINNANITQFEGDILALCFGFN